jgi:hypothetical protein
MGESVKPNPNKLRQWVNQRAAIVTVLTLVVIAATCYIIFNLIRPKPIPVTYAYYYDLGTDAVFTDTADKVPPFAAPSGKAGPHGEPLAVSAVFYSCTSCDNPANRYIAYLQQYTPEAQKHVLDFAASNSAIDPGNMQDDPRNAGLVIRAPGGGLWYPAESDEADEIIRTARGKCGAHSFPSPCFPTK